jgi:hypothetical protein
MKALAGTVCLAVLSIIASPAHAAPQPIRIDPSLRASVPPLTPSQRASETHPLGPSAVERAIGFSHEALIEQRLQRMEKLLQQVQAENEALTALLQKTSDHIYNYTKALRPFASSGRGLGMMIDQTYDRIVVQKVCEKGLLD